MTVCLARQKVLKRIHPTAVRNTHLIPNDASFRENIFATTCVRNKTALWQFWLFHILCNTWLSKHMNSRSDVLWQDSQSGKWQKHISEVWKSVTAHICKLSVLNAETGESYFTTDTELAFGTRPKHTTVSPVLPLLQGSDVPSQQQYLCTWATC